jgi:hypothetical protein
MGRRELNLIDLGLYFKEILFLVTDNFQSRLKIGLNYNLPLTAKLFHYHLFRSTRLWFFYRFVLLLLIHFQKIIVSDHSFRFLLNLLIIHHLSIIIIGRWLLLIYLLKGIRIDLFLLYKLIAWFLNCIYLLLRNSGFLLLLLFLHKRWIHKLHLCVLITRLPLL